MKKTILPTLAFFTSLLVGRSADIPATIDLSGFADSAQHWYDYKNPRRVMECVPGQKQYAPTQIRDIADNILLFQRANGGWPKNYDMQVILTPEQRKAVIESHDHNDTTLDNRTTHTQIVYLARAYELLGIPSYRYACLRGFDFILDAQLDCGGFPQIWPNPEGYHAFITYNDGVSIGLFGLLRDMAGGRNGFSWMDKARREQARAALDRGITCLLATQYKNKQGVLQGWGQQHDPKDMQPALARKYELPSLSGQDTAEIAAFLMEVENPSTEIIRSVKAAVAWLDAVKITGKKFITHDASGGKVADRTVVNDPSAPPMWARLYELETNRPIFAGRDGVKHYDIAEIDHNRRNGYDWYGHWTLDVLTKQYPDWLKKISASIVSDDFRHGLDQWAVEQMPGGTVTAADGVLTITDIKGCTVWFRQKVTAPLTIRYDATMDSGARVSDLNCFWMASDPVNPADLFHSAHQRNGRFFTYDSLRTYYVGYGGNNNTTTRFRRYDGTGDRPLLPEHELTDPAHLLQPGRTYAITITVTADGTTTYIRNGETIFSYRDPQPLAEGWFGFRTVKSKIKIENFRVTKN